MLTLKLVMEVERLLQEGQLSQRKIAARLGVSRATVGAIASGRRGLFGKAENAEPAPCVAHPSAGRPAERCPRCGFRVYMPCLVCRTRQYRDTVRNGSASLPRAG